MPNVAHWIDEMRAAFGPDVINAAIKAGMAGQPTFHATENGQHVGTVLPYNADKAVRMSDIQLGPMNATAASKGVRK